MTGEKLFNCVVGTVAGAFLLACASVALRAAYGFCFQGWWNP